MIESGACGSFESVDGYTRHTQTAFRAIDVLLNAIKYYQVLTYELSVLKSNRQSQYSSIIVEPVQFNFGPQYVYV